MRSRLYPTVKRGFDLLVSVGGLIFVAPLLVVISALIKFDSSGPVFYRGLRTGRFGVPFRVFKFRTMIEDGETRGGTTTGDNDPRITRVGHSLRRLKLDELPQLFNVVLGDMSLVGPRPEVAEYTDEYSPDERRILTVRPGITDLASLEFHQLERTVGSDDPDETFRRDVLPIKNALRLRYVDHQSFSTDLSILARTLLVVLAKPLKG